MHYPIKEKQSKDFTIKLNMEFELQLHKAHLFLNTEKFIITKAYAIYRKYHKINQEARQ